MPDVFTPFRNKVESKSSVRAEQRPIRKADLPAVRVPADCGVDVNFAPSFEDLPTSPGVTRCVEGACTRRAQ